ncbi:YggT family protein [Acinetobacter johnsonii]|jgi:YggT family protein|uniref:YggT family protein n=1 Tax=Acinetobacter johnsonii TaxID=40214 RepID=UPI002447B119|nr:YggT family protein [Acinetobacter johnsonii]MDH1277900.1 YggT family protein [Acinetobacter johnsonii]
MGANSAQIFEILMNVAILLVFFRFIMQLAGVTPYNPVVVATHRATKIVDTFSRIFPTVGKGRINLAALIIVILLYFLKVFGMKHLDGQPLGGAFFFVVGSFLMMLYSLIIFFKYLLIAYIICSWIVMFSQTRSPYIEVIQELAEPMLTPFRRVMPNMGVIDLSPILAFFALYFAEIMLRSIV